MLRRAIWCFPAFLQIGLFLFFSFTILKVLLSFCLKVQPLRITHIFELMFCFCASGCVPLFEKKWYAIFLILVSKRAESQYSCEFAALLQGVPLFSKKWYIFWLLSLDLCKIFQSVPLFVPLFEKWYRVVSKPSKASVYAGLSDVLNLDFKKSVPLFKKKWYALKPLVLLGLRHVVPYVPFYFKLYTREYF